jgi:hypothetical protein
VQLNKKKRKNPNLMISRRGKSPIVVMLQRFPFSLRRPRDARTSFEVARGWTRDWQNLVKGRRFWNQLGLFLIQEEEVSSPSGFFCLCGKYMIYVFS